MSVRYYQSSQQDNWHMTAFTERLLHSKMWRVQLILANLFFSLLGGKIGSLGLVGIDLNCPLFLVQ